MAELGATTLTLVDVAKRTDPDGKISAIAELLSQKNEMLQDIVWKEANKATSHQSTSRLSLPTSSWRMMNQGIAPSKSTTAQIEDGIGMLDAWSEVDVKLAALNGNSSEFRMSEATAFIESMAQEAAGTFIYGNAGTAPEEFNGLAVRYNSTSAANGQNIILGGGAGSDNSSIWLVVWGQETVCGIYPKGSTAGLEHQDLGEVTVETTAGIGGNRMRALQDHWMWNLGLHVKDWRYAVRVPNIDISNLVAKSSAADLYDLMIKATHRVPNLSAGKAVFYMNRSCFQMLDIQGRDDVVSGGQLRYEVVDGKPIARFRNIPVRICDQLTEAESAVA